MDAARQPYRGFTVRAFGHGYSGLSQTHVTRVSAEGLRLRRESVQRGKHSAAKPQPDMVGPPRNAGPTSDKRPMNALVTAVDKNEVRESPPLAVAAAMSWTPHHSRWLVASVVALTSFLEVLNMTIVNVAVPHVAGSLASSNDEATWVSTSYLVSNAIMLPASGWFAGAAGRKRYFMVSLAVFTFSSLLCRLAQALLHAGLSSRGAVAQAYARIYHEMLRQASTLAYVDTFQVLAVGSATMLALSLLLKRNEPGAQRSASAG